MKKKDSLSDSQDKLILPTTLSEFKAALKPVELKENNQWYDLRPILGFSNWALFYILLGGREVGKSYSVTNFFCSQFKNKGIPFIWIRLTDKQAGKLLQNNAEKLVDPDLRRKYKLDLVTKGNNVYHVTKRTAPDKNGKTKIVSKVLFARVYALSTFYGDKGSQFDKDFLNDPNMRYNVAIDEFEREKGEKNTFDILYALTNQLENLLRSTKYNTKIFFLGNTLEDASDILCGFNFIPEEFGTYKLVKNRKKLIQFLNEIKKAKSDDERQIINDKYRHVDFGKRAVIEYIEPSEAYLARRHATIADILMPKASTFTNKIDTDTTLVCKKRLVKPTSIIKFTKSQPGWFTVWDGNIIKEYKNEKVPIIAMRPYLDEKFNTQVRDNVIELFDTRSFMYHNLITFQKFQKEIQLIKPRKGS